MTCEHLRKIEKEILARGIHETFRGQAWTKNCREWVYFDCYLDLEALRRRYRLPEFVRDHSHRGTHDGQERGLVCGLCNDGILGRFEPVSGIPVFR